MMSDPLEFIRGARSSTLAHGLGTSRAFTKQDKGRHSTHTFRQVILWVGNNSPLGHSESLLAFHRCVQDRRTRGDSMIDHYERMRTSTNHSNIPLPDVPVPHGPPPHEASPGSGGMSSRLERLDQ